MLGLHFSEYVDFFQLQKQAWYKDHPQSLQTQELGKFLWINCNTRKTQLNKVNSRRLCLILIMCGQGCVCHFSAGGIMHFILSGHLPCREDFSELEMPIFPFPWCLCVCCVRAELGTAPFSAWEPVLTPSQCICDFRSLTLPVFNLPPPPVQAPAVCSA